MRFARLIPLCLLAATAGAAQNDAHVHAAPQKLGTVRFANSCAPAVQADFNRAVALLHSFQFNAAIDGFNAVLKQDPTCGIAYWGIALSDWGNPMAAGLRTAAQLRAGAEAVEHGRALKPATDRESAYLDAVGYLYADTDKHDQMWRVQAYWGAMTFVSRRWADDTEAAIFNALAMTAAADPADKTYKNQREAGALLERLFAQQPEHPGLAHYIIHTYDIPPLAARAVDAARRYASIAPDAPHALHMPSHTFTRVGAWQESIDTNIRAAAAAEREGQDAEKLHATDYRMYAYLQTGQDQAAVTLLRTMQNEAGPRFLRSPVAKGSAPVSAGYFAIAAIPARYALERGAWAEAAKLTPSTTPFPYADAVTWFARGIGAARSGDAAAAQTAADALAKLRAQLVSGKEPYWALQVEIQQRSVAAWAALAAGHKEDALREMRAAAALEDGTEKSAVTPGPLAPARELLGEMLLELKQPEAAQREFEATLKKEPHRFRALHGAVTAAEASGDRTAASKYRAELLEVCARGDQPGRPELEAARRARAAVAGR
jgi:hypothetical protein